MGLFSFTQEIAMDLGTANTIIITNGKIVVDEPSVVALDRRTDKMIAVGEKAKLMHEKTHENIRTIRPLRDGVIAAAITPSLNGRIVRIFSWVFSCINFAFSPTAIILSVRRSKATTEGSSTTIFPFVMMMVLAVPKSIAISCVKENNPINIKY